MHQIAQICIYIFSKIFHGWHPRTPITREGASRPSQTPAAKGRSPFHFLRASRRRRCGRRLKRGTIQQVIMMRGQVLRKTKTAVDIDACSASRIIYGLYIIGSAGMASGQWSLIRFIRRADTVSSYWPLRTAASGYDIDRGWPYGPAATATSWSSVDATMFSQHKHRNNNQIMCQR